MPSPMKTFESLLEDVPAALLGVDSELRKQIGYPRKADPAGRGASDAQR